MDKIIVDKDQNLNDLVDKFAQGNYDKVVIFEFSMTDCPSCEEIKKSLNKIEIKSKNIIIKEINVSESKNNYDFAKINSVNITPTLIIAKYLRLYKVINGLKPINYLNSIIKEKEQICYNCDEHNPSKYHDKVFCRKKHILLYKTDSC